MKYILNIILGVARLLLLSTPLVTDRKPGNSPQQPGQGPRAALTDRGLRAVSYGLLALGLQTACKRHVTCKGHINPLVNQYLLLLLPSALDSYIIRLLIASALPLAASQCYLLTKFVTLSKALPHTTVPRKELKDI